MNNAVLLCLVVGFFWAASPILSRFSGVNAGMMAVLVTIGTFAIAFPLVFRQDWTQAGSKALMFALLGGIANGIGLLAYYRLVAGANENLWEISRVLPITLVIVPVGIVIGSRIFFNEAITTEKIIGLVLASCAIWFLK